MDENRNDKESFFSEVYTVLREIPCGKVATYGLIATLSGRQQCARLVGQALRNVPANLSLPCHRVVNASGRLAPGWPEQKSLLTKEGVTFRSNRYVDMKRHLWNPLELINS